MASLHTHVLAFLVHELVSTSLGSGVWLAALVMQGAPDPLLLQVSNTDRAIFGDRDQVTTTILVSLKCSLVSHIQFGNTTGAV